MFDIGWPELVIVALIALLVIGPKELPNALRTVAGWVNRIRGLAREFQSGIDDIVRESELDKLKEEVDKASNFDLDNSIRGTIDPDGAIAGEFDGSDFTPFEDFAPDPEPKPAKKPRAKKAAAKKKPPARKSPAAKSKATKSQARKAPAKIAAPARKTAASKTAASKTAASKTAASKTGAKKSAAKPKTSGAAKAAPGRAKAAARGGTSKTKAGS